MAAILDNCRLQKCKTPHGGGVCIIFLPAADRRVPENYSLTCKEVKWGR